MLFYALKFIPRYQPSQTRQRDEQRAAVADTAGAQRVARAFMEMQVSSRGCGFVR
jgi:hypothetical protein